MLCVITYDIANDKRRTKVADELENWGRRVQFSVWECDLEAEQIERLTALLQEMVSGDDRLRVYRLCQACLDKSVVIGGDGFAIDPDFYQV